MRNRLCFKQVAVTRRWFVREITWLGMGTAHVTTKGTKFHHFVAHRALSEKTPRPRLKDWKMNFYDISVKMILLFMILFMIYQTCDWAISTSTGNFGVSLSKLFLASSDFRSIFLSYFLSWCSAHSSHELPRKKSKLDIFDPKWPQHRSISDKRSSWEKNWIYFFLFLFSWEHEQKKKIKILRAIQKLSSTSFESEERTKPRIFFNSN